MAKHNSGFPLFKSRAFSYQALRTMGHACAFGATLGECLSAVRTIRENDGESWFAAWGKAAVMCEKLSVSEGDRISRGKALLRAANYYRASEFFLPASDPRRRETYTRETDAFNRALKALGVPYHAWNVPYERVSMRAYYFPGDPSLPVIMACGGFDSSLEELFFWIGHASIERRHPCILFEGPGQSSMIREYGLTFIPEWEKPLMILLDHAQWVAPEISQGQKIIAGVSMGGMLALRAASRDKRIHAAACLGGFFSMETAAFERLPRAARWAYRLGMKNTFDNLAHFAASRDMERKWALEHGMWVLGASSPSDLLEKTADFSLAPAAKDITCHVLVVLGQNDHLVPATEGRVFQKHLTQAKSLKVVTLEASTGAGEHCQAGATERLHQVFFGWAEGISGR